jgi:hypothetical protein
VVGYATDTKCEQRFAVLGCHGSKWTSTGADGEGFSIDPWYVERTVLFTLLTSLYVATSTDVERAFSCGGLTVSKMRHSLSDQSARAASVLGAWCNLPGAIPREEAMVIFRDKNKRPKGSSSVMPGSSDAMVVD